MKNTKSVDPTIRMLPFNPGEWLIFVLCLLTFTPTLIWMWDRWFVHDSYYSHGILIPFVSLWLLWQRREELREIEKQGSSVGIILIVLGIIVHVLSSLVRVYFTSGLAMLVVLMGMVVYFYGPNVLRKTLFPILFLFFMIPAPLVVIANISFQMKIFAAKIAAGILNQIGLYAVQDGSTIKMQQAYVMVDDICSGLRSLISLTALGSIFAYWMKSVMWKRVVLFLTTIPIAIITNVVRIVLLSFIAEIWGPQYATGLVHDVSGFLVFALAFVLLFAASKVIE